MTALIVKRVLMCLSLTCFAFGLSGCFEFYAPLINPNTANVDTRLLGVWKRTDIDGSKYSYMCTVGRSDIIGHPSGMMVATTVHYDRDEGKSLTQKWYFTTSVINGQEYICADGKQDYKDGDNFAITRYRVNGDQVEWWGPDRDGSALIAQLIKQGVIGGLEDANGMVRYLQNNSGDDLFPASSPAIRKGSQSHNFRQVA